MFWRFGGYANISTLDTVLDKPDVTVEDLLDESDLIQELKQQNGKLIEFLRDEAVLKKLLHYVVTDLPPETESKPDSPKAEEKDERPTTGISFFGKGKGRSRSKSLAQGEQGETEAERREAQRKKYAYVACEVLSSEVWSITEAVLDQRDALREFWRYLHRAAPLDALQAGYFTKVNEALLDKKTEEMLGFFKSLEGIVPAMLQHVDCPMVMDLLLKIISLEKHEGGAGIVDWLQAQDLIPLLLGFLSPEHNSATQTSAGDFLKAIITISANATTQDQSVIGPNELTRQLVSEKCIQTLIDDMLRGGNPLTVGVGIIIEVIRKNNSDYDLDTQEGPRPKTTDPIYLGTLLRKFATHVPDFMTLVRSPSAKKPELKAAFGGKIEPLGFDRFKTCELMAELLHCSNMGLLNERGAEADILKRDAERERLKAEGKLATPKAPTSPSQENSHEEFGSSVDSHGFHHAKRPSEDGMEDDEKLEDVRRLEVQNASDEEGFETVSKPLTDTEDFPDEVTFDVEDERAEDAAVEDSRGAKEMDATPSKMEVSKALSPLKPGLYFDPPPTHSVDSPTTAGVTDKIDKLDVDEDTVMTEFGEEPSDSDDDGPSELEKELAKAHPEDKPAPLFARKEPPAPLKIEPPDEPKDIDASVTTIQGEESVMSNGERAPYETEADGNPVVGDLLKIQFVEHQVVPTILVSTSLLTPQALWPRHDSHFICVVIQDFFFRFPWNNFLHNVVYDVVQQVFNGTLERGYNRTLAFDLFSPAPQPPETLGLASTNDIISRILAGQRASDASQSARGMRLGYMGHLTLIAEEVCKFGNRQPADALEQVVLDAVSRAEWTEYVDGTLAETRDKDNAVLGGIRPQDSIGIRPMGLGGGGGLQGGFSANTASTLASAGIGSGIAVEGLDGGVGGGSFEVHSSSLMGGFEEEEMEMEEEAARDRERNEGLLGEDEQVGELSFEEAEMGY